MKHRGRVAVLLALGACLCGPSAATAGYIDETLRVDDGDAAGNYYDANWVDTSDDGDTVAFMGTWRSNFGTWGVGAFVRHMRTGEIELVSREDGPNGAPLTLPGGEGTHPGHLFMSGNGRFVGFDTEYPLVPEDTNRSWDVYVRDIKDDRTILVSRGPGVHGAVGDGHSAAGSTSDDGRFVLFSSTSSNFSNLVRSSSNVFVRDLQTGTTTLVNCTGDPCVGEPSYAAVGHPGTNALSGDGTRAGYLTWEPGSGYQTVVKDLVDGGVEIATRADGPDGSAANGPPRTLRPEPGRLGGRLLLAVVRRPDADSDERYVAGLRKGPSSRFNRARESR